MNGEIKALLLSTVAALALGAIALIVALATESGAILLDAAFNLCFFATALFTLRVARLLKRPDDHDYPFGYLHFEPLINMLKGLLILGVGVFALADSAVAMYRGGTAVSAGIAFIYAIYATTHCAVILWMLRRAERQVQSPLVKGDVDNWTVNLAISIGMVVAFCLALLLQRWEMEGAAKLIDPILVSLVVLLTVVVPIRMCWHAILALLKRAGREGGHWHRGAGKASARRSARPRPVHAGRAAWAHDLCPGPCPARRRTGEHGCPAHG
jgi:predicted Co/Zn/Cd cation transporter (cation efflux family)